jgi:hypothetical protein
MAGVMASTAGYSVPLPFVGRPLPTMGRPPTSRSRFGDIALIAFLVAQLLDGTFTYVGVITFGLGAEANPVVAALMMHFGVGSGLLGAKVAAAALGLCLHLRAVHKTVACLAGFYYAVAVAPWSMILFV